MVSAVLADVVSLVFNAVKLAVTLALRAFKLRSAVAGNHDLMKAGFIVRKLLLKLVKTCHFQPPELHSIGSL